MVDIDIEEGKKILEKLDQANISISSAFWLFLTDIEEWRLIFATPLVDEIGPKKTYAMVQKIINQNTIDKIEIPLEAISLISPNHQFNKLLHLAIKTGPGISGIRFSGNVINGVLIKDAYLYRVN